MIKLFIIGIDGKMGRAVCKRASQLEYFDVVGGFDILPDMDFKVFTSVEEVNVDYDVVIDFSRPESLDTIVALSARLPRPVVLATTGYSDLQMDKINALSNTIPVFMSGNMSWGVFVLQKLVAQATQYLWDSFDAEIIEKHHNQKVDAPSGTAKMLADSIAMAADPKPNFIYGREGTDAKRKPYEVAIHAVRGGTVVGEHEVSFYGNDEIITLSHSALSRNIFADGALRAAKFLQKQKKGLYQMKDM